MNRPMYESAQDASNESEVIALATNTMKFTDYYKMPISYGFDYALLKGDEIKAVAEVKCRNIKYETLFLSLQKVQKGIEYIRHGLLAYLLIQWPDGVHYYRLEEYDIRRYSIKFGGRKDRNDLADYEPVLHFPIEVFKRLV